MAAPLPPFVPRSTPVLAVHGLEADARDGGGRPLSTDETANLCVAALRFKLWEMRG